MRTRNIPLEKRTREFENKEQSAAKKAENLNVSKPLERDKRI